MTMDLAHVDLMLNQLPMVGVVFAGALFVASARRLLAAEPEDGDRDVNRVTERREDRGRGWRRS